MQQRLLPQRPTFRLTVRHTSSRQHVADSRRSSRRMRVLPGLVCIMAWGFMLVSFTPRADGPVKAPWNRVAREDDREAANGDRTELRRRSDG